MDGRRHRSENRSPRPGSDGTERGPSPVQAPSAIAAIGVADAQSALNVATSVHTVPAAFGRVMAEINPRMAVAYHFFNDFDVRFPMYDGIRRTYKGPLTMATDLLVWNISRREVRVRQVVINPDAWPAPPLSPPGQPDARLRTPFSPFVDGGRIDVSRELAPMIQEFKKENGLK